MSQMAFTYYLHEHYVIKVCPLILFSKSYLHGNNYSLVSVIFHLKILFPVMEVASLKHEGNVVKLIETFKENEYDIFHERNISSEKGMGNISKIFI